METKLFFAICLQVVLVKYTSSQCIARLPDPIGAAGVNGFSSMLSMQNMPFPAPSFSVFSDGLVVEGTVGVSGSLPFLGAVSVEGAVPAAGQGTVMYNAGDGTVGIVAERPLNGVANMYSVRY